MYREVIGMMNFSGGAVIGVILLTPAVAAFLMDLRSTGSPESSSTVTKAYRIEKNILRDILVYLFFGVVLTALCMMRWAGFFWMSRRFLILLQRGQVMQ
jgi:hypothetical protein